MKKVTVLVLTMIVSFGSINAKDGLIAIRAGGGLLWDKSSAGFAFDFDLTPKEVPLVLSPYFQSYTVDDL